MILGGRLHLGCTLRTDDKIDQRASVGRIQLGLRLCGNFQAPSLLPTREPNQLAHSAPEMFDNPRELGKNGTFLRFGQFRHPNKRNFPRRISFAAFLRAGRPGIHFRSSIREARFARRARRWWWCRGRCAPRRGHGPRPRPGFARPDVSLGRNRAGVCPGRRSRPAPR